jgi:hypothetical protein
VCFLLSADPSLGFSLFVGDLADDVGDELLCNTFRTYYPSVKSAKVKEKVVGASLSNTPRSL